MLYSSVKDSRTILGGCVPVSSGVIQDSEVVIFHKDLVNLYGCHIEAGTKIGAFVEIQKERVYWPELQDLFPQLHLRGH